MKQACGDRKRSAKERRTNKKRGICWRQFEGQPKFTWSGVPWMVYVESCKRQHNSAQRQNGKKAQWNNTSTCSKNGWARDQMLYFFFQFFLCWTRTKSNCRNAEYYWKWTSSDCFGAKCFEPNAYWMCTNMSGAWAEREWDQAHSIWLLDALCNMICCSLFIGMPCILVLLRAL